MTKRPNCYSEEVAREVVELMMPKVVAYLKSGGFSDEELRDGYLDEVRGDMRRAIVSHDDAYQICRNLELSGWDPDDELHDLVGVVAHKRIDVHRKFIKEWVRREGISARYRAGDNITFHRSSNKLEKGEITRVETELAQYIVFCEHLGHVRKGVGSQGFYVNYEDVTYPATERVGTIG